MAGVTAVRVGHHLASGESCVCNRAADHEPPSRIDEGARRSIARLAWDDSVDHMLRDVAAQLVDIDLVVVLGRDDDVVDALGLAVVGVTHGHLDLSVGA